MTDTEIIELLKDPQNNERVFRFILKTYKEKIYYHVRKMVINHDDADDVTQEAFIKIWRNLDKFRGDSKLYTWLFRIATNESLTFLSKKKNDISIENSEYLSDELAASQQGILMDEDAIQLKLQKALLTLSDKQRAIFNLKYFEALSYEEISEITDTTVGGLKAMYHLAVKKIEDYLEKN